MALTGLRNGDLGRADALPGAAARTSVLRIDIFCVVADMFGDCFLAELGRALVGRVGVFIGEGISLGAN